MSRSGYLTARELCRQLGAELVFWRVLSLGLALLMLVAFIVGRGIFGGVIGVCALASVTEAAHIRAKLERTGRV